jgi:uncharacterized protein YbjQ (UPF0145 family)
MVKRFRPFTRSRLLIATVRAVDTTPKGFTEQDKRVYAGGLPDLAVQRLSELVGSDLRSSFLSVSEVAVAASDGLEPVGQLVGASSCHLLEGVVRRTRGPQGQLPAGAAVWRERDGPVRSWADARRRALGRLSQQARTLDADAVLGLHAALRQTEGRVEVIFTGTAMRDRARSPKSDPEPVLAMVSVVDYVRLRDAGVQVVGVVGSSSSVSVAPGAATHASLRGQGVNTELSDLTDGVYEARRLALDRLRGDACRLKADGVIGADLAGSMTHHDGFNHQLAVTVLLLGTAIRVRGTRPASPSLVLDLSPRGSHA